MPRIYKRDSDGQFAATSSSNKNKRKKKKVSLKQRKIRRNAKSAYQNSAGRRRLSIAGGKSVSVFVGGTKRATGRLLKKKKKDKK